MACRQHGSIFLLCHRVDDGGSLGRYLKLVAHSCGCNLLWRHAMCVVVGAENGAQRVAVYPLSGYNIVVVWGSAGSYRGNGRRPVYRREGVACSLVYASFLQKTLETFLAVQRCKVLDVVGAQLVYSYVHDKSWGRL